MARCGCSGTSCSCVVQGSGGITVTGSGSAANPYEISGGGVIEVVDTATVDLTLTGDGSSATPYSLSADATVKVTDLTDVDMTGATPGDVLALNGTGDGFVLNPPSTAPAGSVTVGNGLDGDGSGGDPLVVLLDSDSGLSFVGGALRMTGAGSLNGYAVTATGSTTAPAPGTAGSLTGRWTLIAESLCFVSIEFICGSDTTKGTGTWGFTLPVTPLAGRTQVMPLLITYADGNVRTGTALISGGQISKLVVTNPSYVSGSQVVDGSLMGGWSSGGIVSITGYYEVA